MGQSEKMVPAGRWKDKKAPGISPGAFWCKNCPRPGAQGESGDLPTGAKGPGAGGKSPFSVGQHSDPAAAGGVLYHQDLLVDPLFQLGHMGDDAHQPVTLCQLFQGPQGLLQGFLVQ